MKNWKNWLTLGLVVAVFIAAGVTITVALLTEPDPQLLQVCWHPDGRVQYVGGGWEDPGMPPEERICDAPESLIWPQGDSLGIAIVSNTGGFLDGTGDEDLVVEAMDLLNDQLGTHMHLVDSRGEADIVFTFRAAHEASADVFNESGGWCVHRRVGGQLRADGAVYPAGNSRTEYRRTIHELGHCLGLPHWRVGLMREEDLDDSGEPRMDFDVIADPQQDLMREVYP